MNRRGLNRKILIIALLALFLAACSRVPDKTPEITSPYLKAYQNAREINKNAALEKEAAEAGFD